MMSICTPLSFYLQVRNKAADLCLDTRYKGQNERFDIQPCVKDGKGGGEQVSHVGDEIVVISQYIRLEFKVSNSMFLF